MSYTKIKEYIDSSSLSGLKFISPFALPPLSLINNPKKKKALKLLEEIDHMIDQITATKITTYKIDPSDWRLSESGDSYVVNLTLSRIREIRNLQELSELIVPKLYRSSPGFDSLSLVDNLDELDYKLKISDDSEIIVYTTIHAKSRPDSEVTITTLTTLPVILLLEDGDLV